MSDMLHMSTPCGTTSYRAGRPDQRQLTLPIGTYHKLYVSDTTCLLFQGMLSQLWQVAVVGLGGLMAVAAAKGLPVGKGRMQAVLPMYGVVFASEESSLKSS